MSRILTIEKITEDINIALPGYVVLSKEHMGNKVKILVKCTNNHEYYGSVYHLRTGHGCRKCADLKNANQYKTPFEQIKNMFVLKGWVLLDNNYINNNTPMNCLCPKGHKTSKRMSDFSRGVGCGICANNISLSVEELSNRLKKDGPDYELIERVKDRIYFTCNKGHKGSMLLSNFTNSHRCSKCYVKQNEEQCRSIMQTLFGVDFQKARLDCLKNPQTGKNLELDCYNKDLQIALEYNGEQHYILVNYWGGLNLLKKTQLRDELKNKLCKENGIKLITVPYTVVDKKQFILERIKEFGISHLIKE